MRPIPTTLLTLALTTAALAADPAGGEGGAAPKLSTIGDGFARSSVNTVIFRYSPLVSHNNTQFAAYYDDDSNVVIAKRTLSSAKWTTKITPFTGNAKDAHNTISLGIDGSGFLHLAWDHHNNDLNYAVSDAPGSLAFTKTKTDGTREASVTYPAFYPMPNGDLLLLYRVGASGRGDLVLKRYLTQQKKWTTLQQNLISGEDKQNAYPEFTVGPDNTLHLAWTWRSSPDVATNHDVCYARSKDGGTTWTNSKNQPLAMPITAATGEIAAAVPPKSELINQTSISGDDQGRPYIATYWRAQNETVPQYRIVYHDGTEWRMSQVGTRTTPFSLAGGGTKRIPISRPLVLAAKSPSGAPTIHMIFRDIERGEKVSLATTYNLAGDDWTFSDLTPDSYDAWEPSFDPTLWQQQSTLHLLLQKTTQQDNSDNSNKPVPPTPVQVLEVTP